MQLKSIFISILLLSTQFAFAQEQSPTTDAEWDELITYLVDEDYAKANQLTTTMLTKIKTAKTAESEAEILRYIHILCVAALLNFGEYDKEEAINLVKKYEGKTLTLPGRDIITSNCGFNCITMDQEKANTIFVTSSNHAGTYIFGFERYEIKGGISIDDLKRYEGKTGTIIGTLERIEVEGNILPRFRINITEADLYIE